MTYNEVLDYYKTKEAVAAQLGISVATVFRWKKTIPKHYQLAIQTLTNNKLKAEK